MSEEPRREKGVTAIHSAEYVAPPPDPQMDLETMFREHHALVFRAAYRVTGPGRRRGCPPNGISAPRPPRPGRRADGQRGRLPAPCRCALKARP